MVSPEKNQSFFPGLRCNGIDNGCCTKANPCTEGDGDCDNDAECQGILVCGTDNCPTKSPFDNPRNTDDCCMKPAETVKLAETGKDRLFF